VVHTNRQECVVYDVEVDRKWLLIWINSTDYFTIGLLAIKSMGNMMRSFLLYLFNYFYNIYLLFAMLAEVIC